MSRDRLTQAVEAYRVEVDQAEVRSAETLRLILEGGSHRRRTKPLLWVAALTCSAVAAAGIRELPQLSSWLRSASSERQLSPGSSLVAPASLPEPRGGPSPSMAFPAPIVSADPEVTRSKPIRRKVSSPLSSAVEALSRSEPADPGKPPGAVSENGSFDAEDVMFDELRRAHDSVPIEEDLKGWERYLNTYHDGRFAPEARYRRALALARMGRGTEALSAFLWFTSNEEGKYRREDALRWIRALSQEP